MGNNNQKPNHYGYRIIKITPNSPAEVAGCQEFLDFIIDIDSPIEKTPMSGNPGDFLSTLARSENKEIELTLYNVLYRDTRKIRLTPNKEWPQADSLLGILIRYEDYANAHERVFRIAEVKPNSPAYFAGFQAENDYILGSPQYLYKDINDLGNFIELTQESAIKSLEICMYNSQTKKTRSTLILPNKNWGGKGYLGCEFALGMLNMLPFVEKEEVNSQTSPENIPTKSNDDTSIKEDNAPIPQPIDSSTKPINEVITTSINNNNPVIEKVQIETLDADSPNSTPRANKENEENDFSKAIHEESNAINNLNTANCTITNPNNIEDKVKASPKHNDTSPMVLHSQRLKYIMDKREKKAGIGSSRGSSGKTHAITNPFEVQDNKSKNPFQPKEDTDHIENNLKDDHVEVEKISEIIPNEPGKLHSSSTNDNIRKNSGASDSNSQLDMHKKPSQKSTNNNNDESAGVKHFDESKEDEKILQADQTKVSNPPLTASTTTNNLKQDHEDPSPSSRSITVSGSGSIQPLADNPKKLDQEHEIQQQKDPNNESDPTIPNNNGINSNNNNNGILHRESQKYKTIMEYTFFSKKLNGEYTIHSNDLFDIDELKSL